MRKSKDKLFMAATLVLCVLLFLQRLTGEIVHAVLGLILVVILVVHMCRQNGKMKYKKASIQRMDWIMIVSLAVLVLTGLLLHPLGGMAALKILHKLAAILLVVGILGHILQHKKKSK